MLKNMIISTLFLCLYLCLMVILKQYGFHDVSNLILSSLLLGATSQVILQRIHYLMMKMLLLSLLFIGLNDFKSLPFMLIGILLGSAVVHVTQRYMIKRRAQKHSYAVPKQTPSMGQH